MKITPEVKYKQLINSKHLPGLLDSFGVWWFDVNDGVLTERIFDVLGYEQKPIRHEKYIHPDFKK